MQFKHPPKFYFLIFLLLAATLTVVVLFRPEKHKAASVRTPRERVITKRYRESEKPIVQKPKEETTRTEKARKPITQQQESLESIEETKVVTDEEVAKNEGIEGEVRASQDSKPKLTKEQAEMIEEAKRKVEEAKMKAMAAEEIAEEAKMVKKAIDESGLVEIAKEAEAFLKSIGKDVKPISLDELTSLLEESKAEGYEVPEELLVKLESIRQEIEPMIKELDEKIKRLGLSAS